jgi:hypothetical protein
VEVRDRPSAEELLGAVQRFLLEDVVPALDGPRRFHARVAAGVVGAVAREVARGDTDLRAEWRRLRALLGLPDAEPVDAAALGAALRTANEELVRRIRAGDADTGPWRGEVLAHLRATSDEKLAVALAGQGGS